MKKVIIFLILFSIAFVPIFSQSLRIDYKCGEANMTSNQLKPHIILVNTGTSGISLSDITIRYFYEKEGSTSEEFHVDYAVIGASNLTGSINSGYAEIGFAANAGTLAAGGSTGEIQLRINKTDWSMYDQSNDYSFDSSKTAFAEWDHIAIYNSTGVRIYGTEPAGEPIDTPAPATPTPILTATPPDSSCITCDTVITGTISDPDGNPVPGATVTYTESTSVSTTTDASGYFEIPTIISKGTSCPSVIYYLDVEASGYLPGYFQLGLGCGSVNFDLTIYPEDFEVGMVWFDQNSVMVDAGDTFTLDIQANLGSFILSQYGLDLSYQAGSLDYIGYSTASGGFIDSSIEYNQTGQVAISGTYGNLGPGENVHIISLIFKAIGSSEALIDLEINNLIDPYLDTIGTPRGDTVHIDIRGGFSPGPTLLTTPVPTAAPVTSQPAATPVGNLIWKRNVHVTDAIAGTDPVPGSIVQAAALTTNGAVTDANGDCLIEVLAHDTGSVSLSASAMGYLTFENEYPGLPISGNLDISLEPDGTPTPPPDQYTLTVNISGSGMVTVDPPGQTLYSSSTFTYDDGIIVTLQAMAATPEPCGVDCPHWSFTGWEGDPLINNKIVMDGDKTVTAVFYRPTYVPTVEPTVGPTIEPTAEPTVTPPIIIDGGEVFFVPQHKTQRLLNLDFYYTSIPTEPILFPPLILGDFSFTNEIHINTGVQKLAAYGLEITFDNSVVIVNTEEGNSGVDAGPDGFVSAVNAGTPGSLVISGFDAVGTGPGTNLNTHTIHWLAQTYNGTTDLDIAVNTLVDENTNTIGPAHGIPGRITIETITCVLGDVNDDSSVDIVDALLIAQYFVGLSPSGFSINCGDVNCSGSIDIVDALLVAQYFVGLISSFGC